MDTLFDFIFLRMKYKLHQIIYPLIDIGVILGRLANFSI